MDIKEIYKKNKYIANEIASVIIFLIALVPMYFVYNFYDHIEENMKVQTVKLDNDINKAREDKKKAENDIKVKEEELEAAKDKKENFEMMLDKYPQDDRETTIANTELYLRGITQNIEVVKIEAIKNEIVPGEIEQIPFILECRGSYPEMIELMNKINERQFLYVKDINIKLDGAILVYRFDITSLGKRTNLENSDTSVNPAEIKVIMRSNPFGSMMSSTDKNPINNDTNNDESGETVVPSSDNEVTSSNNTNNNTDTNDDTKPVIVIERLYPLDVDAELIQDYNEKRNIIDDNTSNNTYSISLKTPVGTEVMAVKEGKVIFVGKFGSHGTGIMIEHKEGNISYYGNLGNSIVYKGQRVKKGQVVGFTGGTGDLSVPHLKFGYAVNDEFVDPKPYMDIASVPIDNGGNVKQNETSSEVEGL